ncbi:hypothetical protein BH11PSE7_BH11PSE7_15970 [soil metagenome]
MKDACISYTGDALDFPEWRSQNKVDHIMASNANTKDVPLFNGPAGNMPGGEHRTREYKNGDRGDASGQNLAQDRAVGAPRNPVKAGDAGQLPDSAANEAGASKPA